VFRDVVAELGVDTTYASDIDRMGRRLFGERWGGVHSRSSLPSVGPRLTGYVCNTHDGAGVHWVGVLDAGDGRRYLSDPLGAVGQHQRAGLAALQPYPWSDDDAEMRPDERTCGPLALAAVAVGLSHGAEAFMDV